MCGISAILDFTGNADSTHLLNMMGAIKHRGPDASHFIINRNNDSTLFLGSNRLKIIDKNEHSNQPFVSQDGNYVLVFNGEIYNLEELRNELLSLGVHFTTRSDTEMLMHWLIHKGIEGVSSLNGMFAFVFANQEKGSLIVGRDKVGIKPLFIHQSKKQYIISSEINGIISSGLVAKELNEEIIPHYLAYKYAPKPATFYKHIEEFTPGSIWEINSNGKINKSIITEKIIVDLPDFKELLINSILQQYSRDNNTGVMLSGGVDSTLILAILNKELGYNQIPVYSIVSSEKQNKFATQDGSFAPLAAKQYHADYNEISINKSSFNLLDDYIKTIDQPIADSGALLTWMIAQKAKGKSRVLLSGGGADELFAGYNRHKAFYYYLKYRNKTWFKTLIQAKRMPSISSFTQFKKLANSIEDSPSATFNNFIQSDVFRVPSQPIWDDGISNDLHFRNALKNDFTNYLSSDVLAITDHATMQFSIETRVPYLDAQLINASQNIPANYLIKNGPKWILKEMLLQYDGKVFANRKKEGLGLPMNNWFKNPENKHLWDFNSKESHIHQFVPRDLINQLKIKHNSGKHNLTQELWRVLLLHKWLHLNFG